MEPRSPDMTRFLLEDFRSFGDELLSCPFAFWPPCRSSHFASIISRLRSDQRLSIGMPCPRLRTWQATIKFFGLAYSPVTAPVDIADKLGVEHAWPILVPAIVQYIEAWEPCADPATGRPSRYASTLWFHNVTSLQGDLNHLVSSNKIRSVASRASQSITCLVETKCSET